MIEFLHDIANKLDHVQIEYGIFDPKGSKLITIKIKNPNDSFTEHQIKVSDALYLLDKGTVLNPAKQLLQRCKPIIEKYFTIAFSNIISCTICSNESNVLIDQLEDASKKAQAEIRTKIFDDNGDRDIVQKLLSSPDSIVSLNEIAKYIQVKYIIK